MGAFDDSSISSIGDAGAVLSLADGQTYVVFDDGYAGIVVGVTVDGKGGADVTIAPDVRTAQQMESSESEDPVYVTRSFRQITKLKRPPNG